VWLLQKEFELIMSEHIKQQNQKHFSDYKNLTVFTLLYVVSFFAGILCCRKFDLTISDKISTQIISHFADAFYGCGNYTDYLSVIIRASLSDFRHLAFVFAAGFTMFCTLACCVVNICRGFTFGFSLSYLIIMVENDLSNFKHPSIEIFAFVLTKVLVGAAIIYLSTRAYNFGYEFRKLRGRKSVIIRSPLIYRYILVFIIIFGFIILVNSAYCGVSAYLQ